MAFTKQHSLPTTDPSKSAVSVNKNTLPFNASKPVYDQGTKYVQAYDPRLSPGNVTKVQSTSVNTDKMPTGIRMEDYALVSNTGLDQNLNKDALLVIVNDGHGAVPAFSHSGYSEDASRLLGGFECAKLAADALYEYLQKVSEYISFDALSKKGIAKVLHDAFFYAQKRCEQETMKGGKLIHSTQPFEQTRLNHLMNSKIDGYHFDDLYQRKIVSPNPLLDKRVLVADKILEPHGPGFLTYYVNGNSTLKQLAEYGTTATVGLFVPYKQDTTSTLDANNMCINRGTLYIGHVGDSDAYLFYKNPDTTYSPVRLTEDHTVSNPSEVQRTAKKGLVAKQVYFTLHSNNPAIDGYSLMPSRALGHSLLSKYGISSEPSVTSTQVCKGDYIVIASDGLWSVYGRALSRNSNTNMTDEDLAAYGIAQILSTPYKQYSPQELAAKIKQTVQNSDAIRDNLGLVVVKIE